MKVQKLLQMLILRHPFIPAGDRLLAGEARCAVG